MNRQHNPVSPQGLNTQVQDKIQTATMGESLTVFPDSWKALQDAEIKAHALNHRLVTDHSFPHHLVLSGLVNLDFY